MACDATPPFKTSIYIFRRISSYFISYDFLYLFSLEFVHAKITQTFTFPNDTVILWKYFYSLARIFMVSTKCIDPWVLELWFHTLQTTINGKIVFRWIFILVV